MQEGMVRVSASGSELQTQYAYFHPYVLGTMITILISRQGILRIEELNKHRVVFVAEHREGGPEYLLEWRPKSGWVADGRGWRYIFEVDPMGDITPLETVYETLRIVRRSLPKPEIHCVCCLVRR